MFSEILKIIPKLDNKDLAAIERTLNGRFARIAKKFGGGIMSVLKGGGVLAIASTIIDKILNPLKEVQEALDRTLSKGDDLATYAKQFNTTAGNLARLQAFGQATGLDPEGVRLLLGKFQASVAQSAANPGEQTAVSAFVGRQDMAEAFFEFIQSMQKLNATQQNLVQQEVFGEKQILKASEFLNADFGKLARQIGGPTSEELTIAANRIGDLADMRDIMAAGRELKDLKAKAGIVNENMIAQVEQGARYELDKENKRMNSFEDLKKISMATDKMIGLLEKGYLEMAPLLAMLMPKLVKLADVMIENAPAIKASRALRGLTQGKDN